MTTCAIPPMLTEIEFREYLTERRKTESLASIGESLAVSRQAVHQWLTGAATPSDTVRLLAGYLRREDHQHQAEAMKHARTSVE